MGWQEQSVAGQREAFVRLAALEGANVSQLCERFGVSRQTGYVWLRRFAAGEPDFANRSRRPHASPRRLAAALEQRILALRDAHPAWGARKIAALLRQEGIEPPAGSTVHAVLLRHGRIAPGSPGGAYGRFEREAPNELWQMDFKGKVRLGNGAWLHPLTVIDDCSRFAVGLEACADQQGQTVQARLERVFRHHGLPQAIYVDNGPPWGASSERGRWTALRLWLLKLGVETLYSRPYHPQGRGKNERFHRSLNAEVFALAPLPDIAAAQAALARWRHVYNHQRPHQALGFARPAERYHPSPRSLPKRLPQPDYPPGEITRRASTTRGYISFQGRSWRVPDAFRGETLAIRPASPDGCFTICFAAHTIATLDLKAPQD